MCLLVEFLLAVTVALKQHLAAQVTQRIQVLSFSFTPQYFSHLSMSRYQILHSCRIMSMGTQGLMEGSRMVPTNRKVQSGCETGVLFKMICWEGVQCYEKISRCKISRGWCSNSLHMDLGCSCFRHLKQYSLVKSISCRCDG